MVPENKDFQREAEGRDRLHMQCRLDVPTPTVVVGMAWE